MRDDYWTLAHGENDMPHHPEDHNQAVEDALKILARVEHAGQPDPDRVAIAQVHATLALVREQQSANRIARERLRIEQNRWEARL